MNRERDYARGLTTTAVPFILTIPMPFAVSMAIIPTIVTTVIATVIVALAMSFLITGNILLLVPVVMNKKDPLAAGVVFATVLSPIFDVTRRNAEIDGRAVQPGPTENDSRLGVDHSGLREIADVNMPIETGLADADRNANVGSKCRGGESGCGYRRNNEKTFHHESPRVGVC
jgi:hypothetical protein